MFSEVGRKLREWGVREAEGRDCFRVVVVSFIICC